MAKAYSLDLRKKTMQYLADYGNKSEAARVFNINRMTIAK